MRSSYYFQNINAGISTYGQFISVYGFLHSSPLSTISIIGRDRFGMATSIDVPVRSINFISSNTDEEGHLRLMLNVGAPPYEE